MKRRQLLKLLILTPLATLFEACESIGPRKNTTVTGRVIDQDGNPLEGARFYIYGEKKSSIGSSGAVTFRAECTSDVGGYYQMSEYIPKSTSKVWFFLKSNEKIRLPESADPNYSVYLENDKVFEEYNSGVLVIPRSDWGKTVVFNFKYEKI